MAGQAPFVLRKIDEDEFKKRKAEVPITRSVP
jgi:hypothetical protein